MGAVVERHRDNDGSYKSQFMQQKACDVEGKRTSIYCVKFSSKSAICLRIEHKHRYL